MEVLDWETVLGLPGFKAERFEMGDEDGLKKLVIYLSRTEKKYVCQCGLVYDAYWDTVPRRARDSGCWEWKRVYVEFDQVRVRCSHCGIRTEKTPWLGIWSKYTDRLAKDVALACREVRSLSAISQQYGLEWHVVKEIDKSSLRAELDPPDFSNVRRIAIDEIAIRKGHKYASLIIDFDRHRVLWAFEGREKKALDEFYKKLGPDRCSKIEAVGMDMWEPYFLSTKEYCRNADIVYDPFHLIQKYGKVIDKVRNREIRKKRGKNVKLSKARNTSSLKTAHTFQGKNVSS